MKSKLLSTRFEDDIMGHPVSINTKLQVVTEQGTGLMTFRGYLLDYDDYFIYLGVTLDNATNLIRWEEIVTIDLLDLEEEAKKELLSKEPASGAIS